MPVLSVLIVAAGVAAAIAGFIMVSTVCVVVLALIQAVLPSHGPERVEGGAAGNPGSQPGPAAAAAGDGARSAAAARTGGGE